MRLTWAARPRRRDLGVVGLVATALVLTLSTPPAAADSEDQLRKKAKQLQAQIKSQASDVGATSRRVGQAVAQLTQARAQLPAAREAVVQARAQLTAARLQDQAAAAALKAALAEQAKAARAVDDVQTRIDAGYAYVGSLARQAYIQGGSFAELGVALEAESPTDFAGRISAMDSIGRAQDAVLEQLAIDEANLKISQRTLDLAAEETERKRVAAADQLSRTRDLADKAARAKVRVQALVAQAQRGLAVAEAAKAQELANLKKLKAAQAKVKRDLAAASRGSGVPTGELLWPASGSLSQGVGPRIHPVYGYRSCHTGIDIGAAYGSTISAALGGRVISEYSDAAYGTVTLIDHGNGFSTFYAHQSARLVSVGARVSKGQAIGRVGSTGFATGPHLHFEVHINGVPYDPMGWFGGTKRPVAC